MPFKLCASVLAHSMSVLLLGHCLMNFKSLKRFPRILFFVYRDEGADQLFWKNKIFEKRGSVKPLYNLLAF